MGKIIIPPRENRLSGKTSLRWYPRLSVCSSWKEPGISEGCPAKAETRLPVRSIIGSSASNPTISISSWENIENPSTISSPRTSRCPLCRSKAPKEGAKASRATATTAIDQVHCTLQRCFAGTNASSRIPMIAPKSTTSTGAISAQLKPSSLKLLITVAFVKLTFRSLLLEKPHPG